MLQCSRNSTETTMTLWSGHSCGRHMPSTASAAPSVTEHRRWPRHISQYLDEHEWMIGPMKLDGRRQGLTAVSARQPAREPARRKDRSSLRVGDKTLGINEQRLHSHLLPGKKLHVQHLIGAGRSGSTQRNKPC